MGYKPISNEAFNDFLCREVINILRVSGGEDSDSYLPLLVILEYDEAENFPVSVFALAFDNFNDSETRHTAIFELGKQAYQARMRPIAAFLSSEAWIRMCRAEDYDPKRRVADYDDKQEVLIVVGLTIDGRSNAASFVIERDGDNHISLGTPTFLPYQADGETAIEPTLVANFFQGYAAEMQASDPTYDLN